MKTKTAAQIFAEADEILKDCFYVTDVTDLANKKDKGKLLYPEKARPFLCEIGADAPLDGGLGRADLQQGKVGTEEGPKEREYFDAESVRNARRKVTRQERVEEYAAQFAEFTKEQLDDPDFEGLDYLPRDNFSHVHARNDSFTPTYGMDCSE